MKEEIAVASNEVVQLRQELLKRDKQLFAEKKKNLELRQRLQCYRRMVIDS